MKIIETSVAAMREVCPACADMVKNKVETASMEMTEAVCFLHNNGCQNCHELSNKTIHQMNDIATGNVKEQEDNE